MPDHDYSQRQQQGVSTHPRDGCLVHCAPARSAVRLKSSCGACRSQVPARTDGEVQSHHRRRPSRQRTSRPAGVLPTSKRGIVVVSTELFPWYSNPRSEPSHGLSAWLQRSSDRRAVVVPGHRRAFVRAHLAQETWRRILPQKVPPVLLRPPDRSARAMVPVEVLPWSYTKMS